MSRPRFREREIAGAGELAAEQAYLVDLVRRHRIGEHSWGIVFGLALSRQPGGVLVQPGVAIDGFGRELVLPAPAALPADVLDRLEADAAAVWLLYGRVADTPPQRGRWECGPGRHSRWREQPCLRVTTDPDDTSDPRQPPGVGVEDLRFGPQDDPPDASSPTWPVFLGRLERDGAAGLAVDSARRPYAGIVGECIVHPAGRDGLRIGGEPAGFAVQARDAAGAVQEPLTVDAAGNTTLAADTEVGGDVVLEDPGGGGNGLGFTPLAAQPTAAAPWRAYRTAVPTAGRTVNELRLEIEHPAANGDPQSYALSIGVADEKGAFDRCLTITSQCVVLVNGKVKVEGLLRPGPIGIDADDPRFQTALLDRWLRGIANATEQLGTAFAGALDLKGLQLTPEHAAGKIDCAVTATNTGTVLLPSVAVTATITRAGTVVVADGAVGGRFALEPGASRAVTAIFGPFVPGAFDVVVTAHATAPAGYALTATQHGTTTLQVVVI